MVSGYQVSVTGNATEVLSAQVEAHKEKLDADFKAKTKTWSTSESEYQAVQEQVRKNQAKLDSANRKMGGSSYNPDGTLGYLLGYEHVSHLRPASEIIREIHRVLSTDLLTLRQNRIEILLQELNDSFDFDMLSKREGVDPNHLTTNISASRTALRLLNRKGGIPLTKSDVIRQTVSRNFLFSYLALKTI